MVDCSHFILSQGMLLSYWRWVGNFIQEYNSLLPKVMSHWKNPYVLSLFLAGFGGVAGVAYLLTPTSYVAAVANFLLHTFLLGLLCRVRTRALLI